MCKQVDIGNKYSKNDDKFLQTIQETLITLVTER